MHTYKHTDTHTDTCRQAHNVNAKILKIKTKPELLPHKPHTTPRVSTVPFMYSPEQREKTPGTLRVTLETASKVFTQNSGTWP